MTTGFQYFPPEEPFITSHPKLMDNDRSALTNNAGTAFPTEGVSDGMTCYRTDEKALYYYQDGAWKKFADLGTPIKMKANIEGDVSGNANSATTAGKLTNAKNISLGTAVRSTAQPFDGTSHIEIPVNSVKESYLEWGGRNFGGSFGPIDAAMIPDLGANRFAFLNPAGITVQYSTDAGATWIDYGASNDQKLELFSTGANINVGKATASTINANCQLRVIVDTDAAYTYTVLNKIAILASTNGSSGCWCTVDAATEANPSTFVTLANKASLAGWSGWNIINISPITLYANSTSQYGTLRLTFGITSHSTASYAGLAILRIMGFGGVGWITPSNMAKNGSLYSYDKYQNAFFPNCVVSKGVRFSANIPTTNPATEILVKEDGWVKSRTPSEVLSDIGSMTADDVRKLINEKKSFDGAVTFVNGGGNEGGEIHLGADESNRSGLVIDNCIGAFRVFGIPSTDGSTRTGVGSVFSVDPYTNIMSFAGKNVVRSVDGIDADASGNVVLAGKINQEGSRGTLAGWWAPLVTDATALTIDGTVNDEIILTAACALTINNGNAGEAWTKTIGITNASTTVTLAGAGWKWIGNTAPTIVANSLLVMHWVNSFGIVTLTKPS